MNEEKSNWECVANFMENDVNLKCGRYASYWYHKTPRRMLHSMSYYKFASKIIGSNKRVLDIGCNEGLGSWLLAKECGFCRGIDFDAEAINVARSNFCDKIIEFDIRDVFEMHDEAYWDAIVNFDVIEHIQPAHADDFMKKLTSFLSADGVLITGTPSKISQQFASPVSKEGHVNIYLPEDFKFQMKKFFRHVFFFSVNDEIVHTGFSKLAHYYICIACCKL